MEEIKFRPKYGWTWLIEMVLFVLNIPAGIYWVFYRPSVTLLEKGLIAISGLVLFFTLLRRIFTLYAQIKFGNSILFERFFWLPAREVEYKDIIDMNYKAIKTTDGLIDLTEIKNQDELAIILNRLEKRGMVHPEGELDKKDARNAFIWPTALLISVFMFAAVYFYLFDRFKLLLPNVNNAEMVFLLFCMCYALSFFIVARFVK